MEQNTIALVGRLAGAAIIIIGFALAIWGAVDLGEFADADAKFRAFAQSTLTWLAFGGVLYLVAEILARVSAKHGP